MKPENRLIERAPSVVNKHCTGCKQPRAVSTYHACQRTVMPPSHTPVERPHTHVQMTPSLFVQLLRANCTPQARYNERLSPPRPSLLHDTLRLWSRRDPRLLCGAVFECSSNRHKMKTDPDRIDLVPASSLGQASST